MKKRWLVVISTLLLLVLVVPSFAGNAEAPKGIQQKASGECFVDDASREEFRETMQLKKQERINALVEKGQLTKEEADDILARMKECQEAGGNRENCQELGLMMRNLGGGQGGAMGKGQGGGQGLNKKLCDGSCQND
ncbi:MAG: hypothetical protein GX046_03335 [Tissierellia bacterium]|nr:hypothetical protein [Tissierellia bacterium]